MLRNSKLSHCKILRVIDCFCRDVCAAKTSQLVGINRNTVNRYFTVFRKLIFAFQCAEKQRLISEAESDGSFLWQSQTYGMPGARMGGHGIRKPPVIIGIYERNGRVFTELVPARTAAMFQSFIHGKIDAGGTCHAEAWCRYDGLVDLGCDMYYCSCKGGRFAGECAHKHGIEAFWSFAKQRFNKIKGIKKNFDLHLKECEWRYEKSVEQLHKELQKLLSLAQLMSV